MATQQPAPAPIQQPAAVAVPVEHVAVTEQSRYNFRAVAIVGFVVGIVDVFIAARFILKLLGAADTSSFVSFVYGVTGPLVGPFRGIFANAGTTGNVFEPAALVAIAVYALVGWGIVVLIRITTAPKGTKPATS
jgi:uncharacterized protein YggT (Ycf19 family)